VSKERDAGKRELIKLCKLHRSSEHKNFFDATGPAPPSWWCQPEACCEVLARGSAVRSMVGGIAAASSGFGSLLTRSPRSLLVSSLGFAAAAP